MGARAAEAAAPLPSMQHLPGIAALASAFFLVLAKWFLPPYFPRSFTFDSQVKDEARGASPARLIFHARPTFLPAIRARRSRKHSGARRRAAARRCREAVLGTVVFSSSGSRSANLPHRGCGESPFFGLPDALRVYGRRLFAYTRVYRNAGPMSAGGCKRFQGRRFVDRPGDCSTHAASIGTRSDASDALHCFVAHA